MTDATTGVAPRAGAPPPSDAAPATRRGRGACGIVGCLLLVGLLVFGVASTFFLGSALEPIADRYLWAPHDVVREYLTAFDNNDDERARLFVCEVIKSAGLPDPSAPFGKPASWTASVGDEFPYPRPNGQVAIYYKLTSGLGDRRGQALLTREEAGWRICEFTD